MVKLANRQNFRNVHPTKGKPSKLRHILRIVRFFPLLYAAQTQVCPDVQFGANIEALSMKTLHNYITVADRFQ